MNFQHAITLVILGTKGAGKSALIQRFKDNTFDPSSHGKPTKSRVFEFWYHLPPHLIGSAASVDKKKTSPRSSPTSTSPKTEASEVIKIRLIDTGEVNDMELINQWIEASDGIIFVHDIHASANSWGDLYMKWMKKVCKNKQVFTCPSSFKLLYLTYMPSVVCVQCVNGMKRTDIVSESCTSERYAHE